MLRGLQVVTAFVVIVLSLIPYLPYTGAIAVFALTHPLIVLLLALVFGILFGFIGGSYGLAGLFWHDRLLTRAGASAAVTLLITLTGVFAYYTAGPPKSREAGPSEAKVDRLLAYVAPRVARAPAGDDLGRLARFLIVASPPFFVLIIAPAMLPAAFPRVPRSAPDVLIRRDGVGARVGRTMSVESNVTAWAMGTAAWLSGVALGLLIVYLLMGVARLTGEGVLGRVGPGLGEAYRPLVSLFVVLVLFYAVLWIPWVYENLVSAAVAICALLGLLASAYEIVVLLVNASGLPVNGTMTLIGLAAVAWFGLVNYDPHKLRFPGLDAYAPGKTPGILPLRPRVDAIEKAYAAGTDLDGPPLIRDELALTNWRDNLRRETGEQKPKLVILAYSGGALRSGLWVSIVTDRLEQMIPGFGRHVRVITGASGGMLGAGYYLLHRRAQVGRPDPAAPPGPYKPSRWVLDIPRDSIDPVARFIALRDPILGMLPRVVDNDRGRSLEDVWKGLAFPIRDLIPEETDGSIPSIILSPMMIEDGRRLLISNLDLSGMIGSSGGTVDFDSAGEGIRPYSLSALEFFRLFPQSLQFRLNTAIRMNASFPYVSPSVNLPTDPPRRIFDAGVYDDYGVQVASAWMTKNFNWLTANTSGVVLVQVRDALSVDARLGVEAVATSFVDKAKSGYRYFTSAPQAIYSASGASMIFRNDEDVARLSARFTEAKGGDAGFFTTVIFETSAEVTYRPLDPAAWPGDVPIAADTQTDVALDWYLTRAERESMIAAIPKPLPGSPWEDRAHRLKRINDLARQADQATGNARLGVVKQLEQAENYERLVQLATWWNRPG